MLYNMSYRSTLLLAQLLWWHCPLSRGIRYLNPTHLTRLAGVVSISGLRALLDRRSQLIFGVTAGWACLRAGAPCGLTTQCGRPGSKVTAAAERLHALIVRGAAARAKGMG